MMNKNNKVGPVRPPVSRRGSAAIYLAALALLVPGAASPQGWDGTVGVGYAWQNPSGNEDSFRTQQDLRSGFLLEELNLAWTDGKTGARRFTLDAWGFGGAEPSERAALKADLGRGWLMDLSYSRRRSFFGLGADEFQETRDRWRITRWGAGLVWNGWPAARLSLRLRRVERSGTRHLPFWGLNELYPVEVRLDESMNEGTFRIETRSLPVHLMFEQSYASFVRRNRYSPGGGEAIGWDPDLMTDLGTTFEDDRTVPTTVAGLAWNGRRVHVAANALWSSADLDSTGAGWEEYAVSWGAAGTIRILDTVVASASRDALVARAELGVLLAPGWTLRVRGSYRDTSSDSTLLGQRLISVLNPDGGGLELGGTTENAGTFDVTTGLGEVVIRYDPGSWSLWFGALAGSRDVDWKLSAEADPVSVTRDTTGVRLGGGLHLGRRFDGTLEIQHGTFEHYVFRTDPETVDRLTLGLRSTLGGGWSLGATGRFEWADNPAAEGGLSRTSSAFVVSCTWANREGTSSAGIEAGVVTLTSDVDLVLPGGEPGLSRYDLALRNVALHGATRAGILRFRGAWRYSDDTGETWPLSTWNLALRLGVEVSRRTEVAGFFQYWSYDEDRARVDDFTLSRYGVVLTWGF